MYCYQQDGSFTSVNSSYVTGPGEALFPDTPTDDQLEAAFPGYKAAKARTQANTLIMAQIQALEATQTPRRLRDAIAGTDGGWLANLESEIAALRAQLQK